MRVTKCVGQLPFLRVFYYRELMRWQQASPWFESRTRYEYGEKMFGEHRLKSGLAKRVSFRTGAIRVAPLRIYGIRSSYLTFNVLIGFTSRRLLKNVYGHCLIGVQVAESRTDKSGYTTVLPRRFVRGSSIFWI